MPLFKKGFYGVPVRMVPLSLLLGKGEIQMRTVNVEDRELDKSQVDRIALIAPNATINIIRNYNVVEKHHVEAPKEVIGLVRCENPNCITNKPREPVKSKFTVVSHEPLQLKCGYCERITTDIVKHLF